jgi:hypothetical protein
MTNNNLFFLLLLFPLFANAQPDSSKFHIRLNAGYADIASTNGLISLSAISSNSRQWETSLSAGYIINSYWEAGISFSYLKQRIQAESFHYFPVYHKNILGSEQTETKIHLVAVDIYTVGYRQLFSRLYFTPKLAFTVGRGNGVQKSSFQADAYPIGSGNGIFEWYPEDEVSRYSTVNENNISYDYAALNLAPAFTYYLNRHFALNLETGIFMFSTIDWKWDNKQWLANVNPTYWRLGIIVAF